MPEVHAGKPPQHGLRWLWLALAVLLADQATKWLVVSRFELHDFIEVTGFFNLVRVHNTGAAFSMLADAAGWQRLFFIAVAVVASAVILRLLRKPCPERRFCMALALILGGAIGNLIDRVLHGYVIDFLDFHFAGWHWPAFNLADSAITLGAMLLIVDSLFPARRPVENPGA